MAFILLASLSIYCLYWKYAWLVCASHFADLILVSFTRIVLSDKTYFIHLLCYGYYMWQMELEKFVLHKKTQKANVFKILCLGWGCDMRIWRWDPGKCFWQCWRELKTIFFPSSSLWLVTFFLYHLAKFWGVLLRKKNISTWWNLTLITSVTYRIIES